MNSANRLSIRHPALGLAALLLASVSAPAMAADAVTHEVWLVAKKTVATMPDGRNVPMWAFAEATEQQFGAVDVGALPASAPGPAIVLPTGKTKLLVHLRNELPEPVSLTIPGQLAPFEPTWIDIGDPNGPGQTGARPSAGARVRSMAAETPPGGRHDYTWDNLKPGSFLYQSATHPAVQVQMGLYGAVLRSQSDGMAYGGVSFDRQVTAFLNEVDPDFHDKVEAGAPPSSTLRYAPKYHLMSVQAFDAAGQPIPATAGSPPRIEVGKTTLLRFFNAGLRTHVPLVQNNRVKLIAEDGNPYPYPRDQYSVQLDAGKTRDALLRPLSGERIALFDRTINSIAGGTVPGSTQGMLAYLDVTQGGPQALADSYLAVMNTALTVARPGVLANDKPVPPATTLVAAALAPLNPRVTLSSNGAFTYRPTTGFVGIDTFTYEARQGSGATLLRSDPATVTITVSPSAKDDSYGTTSGQTLTVPAPGVLGNDVAGTAPTAQLQQPPANGAVTLNTDGSFTYTPASGFSGTDSFRYTVAVATATGTVSSTPATVKVTVSASASTTPVANADYGRASINRATTVDVLANDVLPNGVRTTNPVVLANRPTRGGTATVDAATGLVTYTPPTQFQGTDTFTYRAYDTNGAATNLAQVSVNVGTFPVATNDTASVIAGSPTTISVLANDVVTLPSGTLDPNSVTIVRPPASSAGTAAVGTDGRITFQAASAFVGTATFTYTVRDNAGSLSNEATVSVTVSARTALQ
ncbi:MAG TPA: Ig-like domain-containing protein [Azospirillum sp.]|nr:Ig-like domain-containing protein [Azospirillum sp.]